ncbi:hypothetical protein CRYUN_Cryun28dG0050900 [Craigia yunnanensis]
MGSLSNETSVEEQQQQLELEDSGRTERAQWLINSPEPPSLWQELVNAVRGSVFPRGRKNSSTKGRRAMSFLQAKLDPQYGLYTSVVPPLIYALMGSSREIVIGPVAVVSMLLSSMVPNVVDPAADPIGYRRLYSLWHSLLGLSKPYLDCSGSESI